MGQARFSKEETVIAEARRRFKAFIAGDSAQLPDDIKEPVFKITLKAGGMQEYEEVRELYKKAETNVEKKHVYSTIGYTADKGRKQQVLEWAISGDIPIQDFFYPVGSVSGSGKEAAQMCWEFYKANFSKIQALVKTANPSLMDAMIQFSARGFCTNAAADEVEAFFKDKDLTQNKR